MLLLLLYYFGAILILSKNLNENYTYRYVVKRQSLCFSIFFIGYHEHMTLTSHGNVYQKDGGAGNSCDRSDNLVLANSACVENLISQTVNMLCKN